MQNKRITENEKQRLREMLERESARRASQKQKITVRLNLNLIAFICCILPFVPILLLFSLECGL